MGRNVLNLRENNLTGRGAGHMNFERTFLDVPNTRPIST